MERERHLQDHDVMRRLVLAVALLVVAAAPAHAGKNVCTVVPDPVSIANDATYTITAHGLTPGVYYWVQVEQADGPHGSHPDTFETADANGDWTVTQNTTGDARDSLYVGTAKVRIFPLDGGKATAASCSFTAVP